jgi:hypothetical protein
MNYTLGIRNLCKKTLNVKLDCSKSVSMAFSINNGIETKDVGPGETIFFMFAEAVPQGKDIIFAYKHSFTVKKS